MAAEDAELIDYEELDEEQEAKEEETKAVKKWVKVLIPRIILADGEICTLFVLMYSRGHYVGLHTSNFRDFILKPELLRAVVDCGFEHPSEG